MCIYISRKTLWSLRPEIGEFSSRAGEDRSGEDRAGDRAKAGRAGRCMQDTFARAAHSASMQPAGQARRAIDIRLIPPSADARFARE